MDRIALLIKRDDKFLVLRKEESESEEWSPITRQIERGETLREAARNETKTVTGADIEFVEKVTRTEIGSGNERIHWYLADEESASEENPNPEKVDVAEQDHEWFHYEEIEELDLDEHSERFFEEHGEKITQG